MILLGKTLIMNSLGERYGIRMQKSKFLIYCGLFGILTGLVLGGCGKAEDNISEPLTEPEANSTAPDIIYTEPPFLELRSVSDETELVFLRSRGYNWTYLESEDVATSGIADSADVLGDSSHLETLIVPEADSGIQAYKVSVAKLPDKLGFTAWDIADVDKNSGEVNPVETCHYSTEEIAAPDFSISLQPGRIYEIYMEWNNDKLTENGFSGIAYYGVKTAGEEPNENELTEKANDILISIDDSYSMTVHNVETREDVKSDADSFKSQFSDILIKYINLDIEEDEYQYTDDSVTYRMEIFDSEGHLVQTIEYFGEYLYIDKVRYREKGAGTTEELYLAIDSLFVEDFPMASFGETDTGEVDAIEEVTMEVTYASPKGAHLVFTNHTNEEYTFGDDYELQVWQDGEWRRVDYLIDNAAFNDIGYCMKGNSSVGFGWGVKWTYFHGILPDGQYRITKTIIKGTGKELEKYRLAAEFTIANAGENKELDEANEKTFYEKAESFGIKKSEAESYFQMLCRDDVIQNGVMELRGLVIDDFDQNGQNDIAIMTTISKLKFLYGTGCIYFYMNGKKTYCFYEEYFPFFTDFYVSSADLDNDGNTEIVFGARGTGNGGSGDWYNQILKYKNQAMERMEIPAETYSEDYLVDGDIEVSISKSEKENTYIAYCEYLNDEIVLEAPDSKRDYSCWGSNHRGFYDVQCVPYQGGYALQTSVYLYGRGVADSVGDAKFLIVWDEDGSSHFEKWWIEFYQHE